MKFLKFAFYKNTKEDQVELNFSDHSGEMSNTWVLNQSPEVLNKCLKALKEALTFDLSVYTYHSELDLVDENLVEWTIKTTLSEKNIFKNGQQINSSFSIREFFHAFQNNPLDDNHQEKLAVSLQCLTANSHSIFALNYEDDWKFKNNYVKAIESKKTSINKNFRESFLIFKDISDDDLKKMIPQFKTIYNSYSSSLNCLRDFEESIKNRAYRIEDSKYDYKKQLLIIKNIEELVTDLTASDTSAISKKEQIQIIDEEIRELLLTLQIDDLPELSQIPNWSEVFATLCRQNVLEKMVKYTSKILDVGENKLHPIYKNFIKSLSQLVEKQEHYTDEMEACIANINVQLATNGINIQSPQDFMIRTDSQTTEEKVEFFSGWFEKLKAKLANEEKSQQKISPVGNTKNDLEDLRLSLEHALVKFAETRIALNNAINRDNQEWLKDIQENYEKQVAALSKVKQEWKKTRAEFSFPEDVTLKQLMLMASHYMRLFELKESKRLLEDSLEVRKKKIKKLAILIEDWRKAIQSQKAIDLDNSATIITEANGIIRYKNDRVQKIEQQDIALNQYKDDMRIQKLLDESVATKIKEWNSLFDRYELNHLDIQDPVVEDLFKYFARKNELEDILRENEPERFSTVLQSSVNKNANFWYWGDVDLKNNTKIDFLNSVEKHQFAKSLNLFFIADASLADFFVKIGAGHVRTNIKMAKEVNLHTPLSPQQANTSTTKNSEISQVVQSKTLQSRIIKSQSTPEKQMLEPKKLQPDNLNPKARAVLDILNHKRTQRP